MPSMLVTMTVGSAADAAEVTNVVVVGGAFADGSGWRSQQSLEKNAYKLNIVQEPRSINKDITPEALIEPSC